MHLRRVDGLLVVTKAVTWSHYEARRIPPPESVDSQSLGSASFTALTGSDRHSTNKQKDSI